VNAGARSIEAFVVFFFLLVVAVLVLRKLGVADGPVTSEGESVRCRPAVVVVPRPPPHDGHARTRGGAVHVRTCTA
jgi:hypothetical protein